MINMNEVTTVADNKVVLNGVEFLVDDKFATQLLASLKAFKNGTSVPAPTSSTESQSHREAVTHFDKPWVANWSVDTVDKTTGKKTHKTLVACDSVYNNQKFYVLSHSYTLKNQKPVVKLALASAPKAVGFKTEFVNQNGRKVQYDTFGFLKLKEAQEACKWLEEHYPVLTPEQLNTQTL